MECMGRRRYEEVQSFLYVQLSLHAFVLLIFVLVLVAWRQALRFLSDAAVESRAKRLIREKKERVEKRHQEVVNAYMVYMGKHVEPKQWFGYPCLEEMLETDWCKEFVNSEDENEGEVVNAENDNEAEKAQKEKEKERQLIERIKAMDEGRGRCG